MVAVVKIPVISLNFFYDQLAMFSDWIHLRVGMNLVCPLQSRSIGSTLGLWCKLSLFIPPRKKVFQVQMNRLFASTCPEPVVTVSLHIVLPTDSSSWLPARCCFMVIISILCFLSFSLFSFHE
ncbi:uncharacterized protein LOC131156712 isoform X1 [Malania oleifera]|uniref:uncharacterized protein LOC131156712 isoform X1 n=1 Tax=Malania oleifera TaxID=397392 RepID=UPI0025AEC639|nr:uncharacterized protein LOC131156712 isoform X1 [Malania oleifera]